MKKLLLGVLLLLFFLNSGYGQLKISMNVYKDSLLNSYLSNVKIKLISVESKKKFKIKSLGEFSISVENSKSNYSIEIKKKGYTTMLVTDIKADKNTHYQMDVILRKAVAVGSIEHEGPSELITLERLNL